jgi:hypothetical protein
MSDLHQTRRKVKENRNDADGVLSSPETGTHRPLRTRKPFIGLVESSLLMARTSTVARPHVPLGSLTQPGARRGATCRACGSDRVTRIAMNLTDGSPVEFTSCHHCEHRTWAEQGSAQALPVTNVLDRTRKL